MATAAETVPLARKLDVIDRPLIQLETRIAGSNQEIEHAEKG
jgi:hypothetical protein